MKIDLNKIERAMAKQCMKKMGIAKKMDVAPEFVSRMLKAARDGADVQPHSAGRLARALCVPVESIECSPAPVALGNLPVSQEPAP